MPGGFELHTQAQNVQYVSGNTKTLSNLCSQKLVTGPTGWSSTNLRNDEKKAKKKVILVKIWPKLESGRLVHEWATTNNIDVQFFT